MKKITMVATMSVMASLVACAAQDDGTTVDPTVVNDKADRGGASTPTSMPAYSIFVNCSIGNADGSGALAVASSPAMTVADYVTRGNKVDLVVRTTLATAEFGSSVAGVVEFNAKITNHRDVALTVTDVAANKTFAFAGAMELSPTRHGQILDFAPAFESAELRGMHFQCTRN